MPKTASPARMAVCRGRAPRSSWPTTSTGRSPGEQIEAEEGRTFVHPFEGPLTALGTATLGLEFAEQARPSTP